MEKKKKEPTLAPGIDDQDELEEKATKDEIVKGDFTNVITLSYDENNPS